MPSINGGPQDDPRWMDKLTQAKFKIHDTVWVSLLGHGRRAGVVSGSYRSPTGHWDYTVELSNPKGWCPAMESELSVRKAEVIQGLPHLRVQMEIDQMAAEIFVAENDEHDFQPGQWWLQELAKISYLQPLTKDQVRACAVALKFAGHIFGVDPVNGKPDCDLTVGELQEKYDADDHWGQHPVHTLEDWREEATSGATRIGYWEWLRHKLNM